jgi:hypothetical protein
MVRRNAHAVQRPAYANDLRHEEWQSLAPLFQPERTGGNPANTRCGRCSMAFSMCCAAVAPGASCCMICCSGRWSIRRLERGARVAPGIGNARSLRNEVCTPWGALGSGHRSPNGETHRTRRGPTAMTGPRRSTAARDIAL